MGQICVTSFMTIFNFCLFQLTLPNDDGDLVPIALASSDNYIPVPGLQLHTTVMAHAVLDLPVQLTKGGHWCSIPSNCRRIKYPLAIELP